MMLYNHVFVLVSLLIVKNLVKSVHKENLMKALYAPVCSTFSQDAGMETHDLNRINLWR